MTITAFSGCSVDRKEYGRYARQTSRGDLGKIVVTAEGIQGDPGDVVVYSVVNIASGRTICRKEQPYDSMDSDHNSVTFDLENDCKDEHGLFRAVRGSYLAVVSDLPDPAWDEPTVVATSDPFHIRIVTAAELRDRWFFGVRLTDYNRLVADDTGIPGVVVTGTVGFQEGAYPLRYVVATGALAVGSMVGGIVQYGIPVILDKTSATKRQYTLWNDAGDGYIFVEVVGTGLPTVAEAAVPDWCGPAEPPSVHGNALLRPAEIDDDLLGRHLDSAAETWQTVVSMAVPLEPWTVGTDYAAAALAAYQANYPAAPKIYFDRTGVDPEPWRDTKAPSRAVGIKLPGRRALVLHFMAGFYNSSSVLEFNLADWWVLEPYNGMVNFVPNLSARLPAGPVLVPFGLGAFTYGGYLYGSYVPSFWHFAYTHGLKDLRTGPGETIREAIMREALLPIYLLAGRAAQSIYTAESFNRDGVGLQRSYTSGQMGVYSAEITAHSEWVKQVKNPIVRQLRGISALKI